jgi:uncharacterized protein YjbI with pentapeptide repeats
MDQEEALKLLRGGKEGVSQWNQRRVEGEEVPDLQGTDLNYARLSGARLSGANLSEAGLNQAQLNGARLNGARLDGAHLYAADLRAADLRAARLRRADLSRADLSGANLHRARLAEANLGEASLTMTYFAATDFENAVLEDAMFAYTVLSDLDLSSVRSHKHLVTARHAGPSSIGIDTVLRSGGKIPDEFLRGCGYDPRLQKIILGNYEALTEATYKAAEGRTFRLQSCFISYSTRDTPFADRLQEALNSRGVEYWYAPEHGQWGERLTDQIDRQISLRDRVLLVCSKASLGDSDWVQWEIENALEEEESRGKQVIFPIMIDDALLEWSHPRATRIREVLAGDFRKATKGKAFERAVDRLVAALQAEEGKDRLRPGPTG